MTAISFNVDLRRLQQRVLRGEKMAPATLDRFVQRAANEFTRAEKLQAPKALSLLTNSIQATKLDTAYYSVGPRVKYAAAVNNGGRPHWAPLQPLKDWLRVTKRVTDQHELHDRAKGLQRFIAAHGTRANPFVSRTRTKMDNRVIELLRTGAETAFGQDYQ